MSALTDLFTSIANAIRTKKGTSEPIQASDFPTEIANLPAGSWDEYFSTEYGSDYNAQSSNGQYGVARAIIKMPPLSFPSTKTSMSSLFYYMGNLTEIDLSGFHTENVTTLAQCFYYCTRLKAVDMTGLTFTNKLTSMSSMFNNCINLKTVTFPTNIDTSNVTTLQQLFSGCALLESAIDFSNFNTAKVTHIGSLLNSCRAITTVTFGNNFNCALVTNVQNTFASCTSLQTINGKLINIGQGYTSTTANYAQYKIDLSSATNLTAQSLLNMIDGLYDLATAGKARQSFTIGNTNIAKLTSAQIAVATNKGWNVS